MKELRGRHLVRMCITVVTLDTFHSLTASINFETGRSRYRLDTRRFTYVTLDEQKINRLLEHLDGFEPTVSVRGHIFTEHSIWYQLDVHCTDGLHTYSVTCDTSSGDREVVDAVCKALGIDMSKPRNPFYTYP